MRENDYWLSIERNSISSLILYRCTIPRPRAVADPGRSGSVERTLYLINRRWLVQLQTIPLRSNLEQVGYLSLSQAFDSLTNEGQLACSKIN